MTDKSGEQALALIRHDAAHVLAAAVMELWPGVKISIGPAIENGFYYDFEFPEGVSISEDDFPRIEERMRAHVRAAERFERVDVTPAQARERFAAEDQEYKVELIDDLVANAARAGQGEGGGGAPLETVSLYTNGPFTDLCRGPHAPTTKSVGAFKLMSVAGAYWRGDSTRTMLTRIYGTAFFSKAQLEEYLERVERAKERDHRKLGKELGLFMFSDVSPGAAFWLPPGAAIWNQLVAVSREMGLRARLRRGEDAADLRRGAVEDLGALGEVPQEHVHGQGRGARDGREADELPRARPPVRLPAPLLSGPARALLRARPAASQRALRRAARAAAGQALRAGRRAHLLHRGAGPGGGAGLPRAGVRDVCAVRLRACAWSSRRARTKRIGTDEMWDKAEEKLKNALDAQGLQYELNPGDGAFYGPKIDMHMTDSLGRSLAAGHGAAGLFDARALRSDVHGRGQPGAPSGDDPPRAFGSYERFIGIMLEHYGGELPLWLAPVQAIVLPISDPFNEYGATVRDSLRQAGLRVELDARGESIGRKIREAELRKIPRMLIVGERELQAGEVVGARARQGRYGQRLDRGADGGAAARHRPRERAVSLFKRARGAILGPVEARQFKAPRVNPA